jgi:hypothetical protein
MKLLVEKVEEVEFITEDVNGSKQYFIEGIFLQSEIENRNGRIYPKSILEKEVARYIRESIDNDRAVGELNHNANSINPDPTLISHKIISLKESGNNFVGKALVLDTPNGRIVKALMEGKVKFGVSSKGLGTLTERNGKKYVSEDYKLSTAADVVWNQSAPDAIVNHLIESVEYDIDENGIIYEMTQKVYKATSKSQLEEARLNAFKHIIKKMSV